MWLWYWSKNFWSNATTFYKVNWNLPFPFFWSCNIQKVFFNDKTHLSNPTLGYQSELPVRVVEWVRKPDWCYPLVVVIPSLDDESSHFGSRAQINLQQIKMEIKCAGLKSSNIQLSWLLTIIFARSKVRISIAPFVFAITFDYNCPFCETNKICSQWRIGAPLKFDRLFFFIPFCMRVFKNNAQIARERASTKPETF